MSVWRGHNQVDDAIIQNGLVVIFASGQESISGLIDASNRYFRSVPRRNPDEIKLVRESIGWSCLSGVGWRVGIPAAGGLGTVTHVNERDIMKEKWEGGD